MGEERLSSRNLMQFHECPRCGSLFRREEFDARALSSGVYPCTKCGHEAPLHIVIRDLNALFVNAADEQPKGSSSC